MRGCSKGHRRSSSAVVIPCSGLQVLALYRFVQHNATEAPGDPAQARLSVRLSTVFTFRGLWVFLESVAAVLTEGMAIGFRNE